MVIVGTADGKVLMLPIEENKVVSVSELKKYSQPVLRIFYDEKSKFVVIVDMMCTVSVFNLETFQMHKEIRFEYQIQDCDFEFPMLAVALSDHKICLLDLFHLNK
jgi:hypothetical protein